MSTDVQPTARGSLSERVGMEIKVAMVRAGISGRELARRLGVSQTWVSTRVNGVTPLDLDDMQRIADALDVPVIRLLPDSSRKVSDLNPTWATADHKDDPERVPHVAPRPFSPIRRDRSRPVSAIPATRRRPTPVRPGQRPMREAS